jgi:putative hydrolase of the HAD superfamily
LHIITNGFKEVQHIKLDYSNLKPFFKHIIISEDHGFNKPDIKIFNLAQSLTKSQNQECVMIGDNYDADILGALNANWKAIYLSENTKDNRDENFIQIKRLIELKDFFK